jgi:hypothetical protein
LDVLRWFVHYRSNNALKNIGEGVQGRSHFNAIRRWGGMWRPVKWHGLCNSP